MANIIAVDQKKMTVTVQAGATLHQVCVYLKKLGLQLPVILEFGNFQIGAMSGTHANDTASKFKLIRLILRQINNTLTKEQ